VIRLLPATVAVLLLASACTDTEAETEPKPLVLSWQEATLPVPPGPAGRIAVRDATTCAGTWYVVGGVFPPDPTEDSRPAAWSSPDGVTWTSLELDPTGYWAQRAVFSSVACRDGEIAMVGAKSGGAHGNPRVTTWYHRDDGAYADVVAAFELYGGPLAVTVGRIAGGPDGWLIAGARTSGAAAWLSDDATDFRLVDDDPGLSSDESIDTLAWDQVYDGERWTVVGSASVKGRLPRVPMAWTSPDGEAWHRQEVPGSDGFTDLERVINVQDGLLAAGIRGDEFGTWQRVDGTWKRLGLFGTLDPDRRAGPFVSALTPAGAQVFASVSDGTGYALWASDDGRAWQPVTTPTTPTTAGEHIMSASGSGNTLLLLADDGESGRVWLAPLTG
jgi:hypothetical protein